MTITKKIIATLGLMVLSLGLTACFPTDEQKKIYNDETKISSSGNSYTYKTRIEASKDKYTKDIKYTGFTGDETVYNITVEEEGDLKIDFNSTVDKGSFKVVLINENKEVKVIFEGEKKGEEAINLKKGDYKIKFVGLEASGEVNISIKKNEKMKI